MRVRYLRRTPSGRHEVRCLECGNYLWPTGREMFAWTVCAHCAGWWTL